MVSLTVSRPRTSQSRWPPAAVSGRFHNEVLTKEGRPRPLYQRLFDHLQKLPPAEVSRRLKQADAICRQEAVTYFLEEGSERILPVDWLPRLVDSKRWRRLEKGLAQRLRALNRFCHEAYHGRQEVIPEEILKTSLYYYPQCEGLKVPQDIYIHVYGPDLLFIHGEFVVLEDNLRVPSGISYAEKYREVAKRVFSDCFSGYAIEKIDAYAPILLRNLRRLAPPASSSPPNLVLLTEGSRNAAYFEHKFLSEQMGIPLVEPSDLFVDHEDICWLRTACDPQRVDIIYRRVQEVDRLIPGISRACRRGNLALANAWGTGIADDKATFPYVEEMIRRYLGEEPLLRNVPTYGLGEAKVRAWVLSRLDKMVVKCREGYGGHGILFGPTASKKEREEFRDRILANPLGYVAQEYLDFSTHLLWKASGGRMSFQEAFVDLRTYVLLGEGVTVLPGGITRVAQPGSRVVNSSAGGLIKDTWIVE